MDSFENIKSRLKNSSRKYYERTSNIKTVYKPWFKYVIKSLIMIVIILIVLILVKKSENNKHFIYDNVYGKHFKFASVNYYYKKYLGHVLPFQNIIGGEEKEVFNEKLTYKEANKYIDGVVLSVSNNYLVPIIESGIVVYIGEKEGYGNTIIVQQINGVDTWYGNIKNSNVQIYEYVEKGKLLGEVAGDKLYLVLNKEGKFLNYKDYIE